MITIVYNELAERAQTNKGADETFIYRITSIDRYDRWIDGCRASPFAFSKQCDDLHCMH